MKNGIENLRVALTGAYGGIGSALAVQLHSAGADLYLIGRNREKLEQLKTSLGKPTTPTQNVNLLVADLTVTSQLDALTQQLAELPPINVLINNAGISHFGLFESTSDQVIDDLVSINVTAVMKLTKRLLPMLTSQDCARIINVGSVFGSLAYPGFAAYSSSKFALRGFSEALSREVANSSVSVGHFTARATDTDINSDSVVALNKALKTHTDTPQSVAAKLLAFIHSKKLNNKIQWPEKLFVQLNSVFPNVVSKSLNKQLSTIQRFAKA